MGKIEWSDKQWNPVVGCTKVSEGCKNCYAEAMFNRFNSGIFTNVKAIHDRFDIPYKWKKPQRIFVCSMSDLFHPDIDLYDLSKIFWTIVKNPHHTYFILTKRPENMLKRFLPAKYANLLWVGVSVENQKAANERIPILTEMKAKYGFHAFVSFEPLLEEIDTDLIDWTRIEWVIVGGESGAKSRYFNPNWARILKNKCRILGIPFFMKQYGTMYAKMHQWTYDKNNKIINKGMFMIYDFKGSHINNFHTELQVREF